MSGAKLYRFEVHHPDYGSTIVTSIGPDSATNEAAKVWDAPWREIAGYCRVTRLGTADKPRCRRCYKEFGEPGDTTAYCMDCQKIMEAERRRKPRFFREDRRAGMREE